MACANLFITNRQKTLEHFPEVPDNGFIILEGGHDTSRGSADTENVFRQESFFYYLFGVNEPGLYGAININTKESILFIPRLGIEYEVWCGKLKSPNYYIEKFKVSHCFYVDEISQILKNKKAKCLYLLYGKNSDSGNFTTPAHFEGIESFTIDKKLLHPAIVESRVIKNKEEIDFLTITSKICSEGHIEMIKKCRPGMFEYQLESIFKHYCYYNYGARHEAYTCIAGSGPNSAILHYGHAGAPNNRAFNDGDMVLVDMGCELECYASDITRTFPVNGKFTKDQKEVYEIVLEMQKSALKTIKAGVSWVEVHQAAYNTLSKLLLEKNFCIADNYEELNAADIPAIFFPHGLGHLMGVDVHDVGGYSHLSPDRPSKLGFSKLRTSRILMPGMVITVEPGMYFIDALLDPKLVDPIFSKYLNKDKISRFRNFGGVRIEDNVIVTNDGHINMTFTPKTVEDIEQMMKPKGWLSWLWW